MTKEAGMQMTVAVDNSSGSAQQLETNITSLDFGTPRGVQDITGVDSRSMERLLTISDFTITLNGVFDDGSNLSHAVLKTISSTSVTREVTIAQSGQNLAVECVFSDYALTRAVGGDLTWTAPGQMNEVDVAATWTTP